ncbi:MAG: hypothetical protein AAB229_06900 [Candidatus Hydrogenedentota bacterium]
MYHLAKALEATGLGMIAIGFVAKFPELMSPRLLLMGMALFGVGWLVERYGAKRG